jgi:hypothetical protein
MASPEVSFTYNMRLPILHTASKFSSTTPVGRQERFFKLEENVVVFQSALHRLLVAL